MSSERALHLQARRAQWQATLLAEAPSAVLLIPAGCPIPIEGTDQAFGFRPHDDHRYLAGTGTPGSVLVLDPAQEAPYRLFAPVPDAEDRVWHGPGASLSALEAESGGLPVSPRSQLESVLARLGARPVGLLGATDLLDRPGLYGIHPGIVEELALDAEATARLTALLHEQRRLKDPAELAAMRRALEATDRGHREAMAAAQVGWSESRLAVELHAGFGRLGGAPAYDSIVAGGPNAAVLHAAPGLRPFEAEDLILIDAGAEWAGYDSDVTRTFPVQGRFEGSARDLYEAVLGIQERAITGVRDGKEYAELHMEALEGVAAALVELGLLVGRPEDLVASDTAALFMPHGLGHPIGLATHDVAGRLPDRPRSTRPGIKYLRTDRPLETGMVVTIEPGIYFIPALLDDPDVRMAHRGYVRWDELAPWIRLGGVRIEDDVLVGADGPEVLSAAIPKSVEAVEAACAQASGGV